MRDHSLLNALDKTPLKAAVMGTPAPRNATETLSMAALYRESLDGGRASPILPPLRAASPPPVLFPRTAALFEAAAAAAAVVEEEEGEVGAAALLENRCERGKGGRLFKLPALPLVLGRDDTARVLKCPPLTLHLLPFPLRVTPTPLFS